MLSLKCSVDHDAAASSVERLDSEFQNMKYDELACGSTAHAYVYYDYGMSSMNDRPVLVRVQCRKRIDVSDC